MSNCLAPAKPVLAALSSLAGLSTNSKVERTAEQPSPDRPRRRQGGTKARSARSRFLVPVSVSATAPVCVSLGRTHTTATDAITGTITCTNKGTNQSRDAKTGADDVYKFSILTHGDHRLNFSGTGFKPIPR